MMDLSNPNQDWAAQDWSGFAEVPQQENVGGWGGAGAYTGDTGLTMQDPQEWAGVRDFWTQTMAGNDGGYGGFNYTPNKIDVNAIMQPTWAQMATSMGDQYKDLRESSSRRGQTGSMFDWQAAENARRMNEAQAAMLAPMIYGEEDKYRTMQMQAAAEAAGGERARYQNRLQAANALFGMGQQGFQNAMGLSDQLAGLGGQQFGMESNLAGQYNNPAWMQQGQQLLGTSGANTGAQTYQPSFWEQLAGAAGAAVNSPWGQDFMGGGGGWNAVDWEAGRAQPAVGIGGQAVY